MIYVDFCTTCGCSIQMPEGDEYPMCEDCADDNSLEGFIRGMSEEIIRSEGR